MSNLQIFNFESHEVRFVGTAEKPEWVAQDVADVLGIKNVRQNLNEFDDDDEKGVCTVYTPGGEQEMLTVTEAGLYRLIFKSRKPIAKVFKRWVLHEVLPSIRKTGQYSMQEVKPQQSLPDILLAIQFMDNQLLEAGIQPNLVRGVSMNSVGEAFPELQGSINERHSLLAAHTPSALLLTPTAIAARLKEEGFPLSAKKVNLLLLAGGYQERNENKRSKTEPAYFPTKLGAEYSNNTLATGRASKRGSDNSTYQHLKWKEEIVDIVRELFLEYEQGDNVVPFES